MKNILIWVCLLGSTLSLHAQYFRASMDVVGQELIFYLQPNPGGGNISVGWSGIEFFVRFPSNSPSFNWGAITINSTDFPGIVVTNNGNNTQGSEAGYINTWFGNSYLPGPNRTYADGQEYEVFRVAIDRAGSDISFELVANEWYFPTYLALNGELGQDLTAPTGNKFYGDNPITCSCPVTTNGRNDILSFPAILPVSLLQFQAASRSDESVQLSWEAVELDFSHYELERSINGQSWQTLAKVQGRATAAEPQTYEYLDVAAWWGQTESLQRYYRLRMVDVDGSYSYSPVRSVNREKDHLSWQVFPNPASDQVQLNIQDSNGQKLFLYDTAGRLLETWQLEGQNSRYTLDCTAFPAGSYWLQLERLDRGREQVPLQLVR